MHDYIKTSKVMVPNVFLHTLNCQYMLLGHLQAYASPLDSVLAEAKQGSMAQKLDTVVQASALPNTLKLNLILKTREKTKSMPDIPSLNR